jgi:4-methylaminobutanoate oxidase (formaldehyde-forming)
MVAAGYRAIDALRLEKGYRAWSSDVTPERTPDAAGLGFAVKLDKGEFKGRDVLEAARAAGEPPERLVTIVLEDPRAIALGSEPVKLLGGDIVGRVTSGGFGYTTEASIVLAYVPSTHAAPGTRVEVDIFGDWIGGEVRADPLYDPAGERVRA